MASIAFFVGLATGVGTGAFGAFLLLWLHTHDQRVDRTPTRALELKPSVLPARDDFDPPRAT